MDKLTRFDRQLTAAEANLQKAKRKHSVIMLLIVIMIIIAVYTHRVDQECFEEKYGDPDDPNYGEYDGGHVPPQCDSSSVTYAIMQMGFPISLLTAVILFFSLPGFMDLAGVDEEEKKVNRIRNSIRKEKRQKGLNEQRKNKRIEDAEYRKKELKTATELRNKGGIENLKKALDIFKKYE